MNKENTSFKNSVFVDLFYEDATAERNDISLYNALHGEALPITAKINKFRISNVLYMNFLNDISFDAENKIIIFGEHQSTINYNIPLRDTMYIGRALEEIIPTRDRYRKNIVKIPRPEFYTFYNGTELFEKEKILRLSDAYMEQSRAPMLELCVRVININPDKEHGILKRCQILGEYGIFVDTVRKFKNLKEPEAIQYAIEECIKNGVLEEYLKRKGSQVNNMLVAEYDYELDIEVQREEAEASGKAKGKAEDILEVLGEDKVVPDSVKTRIMQETNLDRLREWLKNAVKAKSMEDFMAKM